MLPEQYIQNLDGMWPDDLRKYVHDLQNLDIKDIEDAVTRDNLVKYAETKAKAMEARVNYLIAEAISFEYVCEDIYESLPQYARW